MAGKDYGVVVITMRSGPLAGQMISAMGEVKMKQSGYKISAEVTADNRRMNRSFEPAAVMASCDFDRGEIDWDAVLNARFDLTWQEVHRELTHSMADAGFTGEAQASLKDGKMSGLEVACVKADYRVSAN